MSEDEPQMTESKRETRDRELYQRSVELCKHSNSLLQEARDLRQHSQVLRAMNGFIAPTNMIGNARRHPNMFGTIEARFEHQRRIFSISIPLRGFRQNSDEDLKIVDESNGLY